MNIRTSLAVQTRATILGAVLLLSVAAPPLLGQYGGLFVSATPQTPIQPGEPLNISVVVENDTMDVWEPGVDLEYSWLTQVDNPSWCATCPAGWFVTTVPVDAGTRASMTVTLAPADLPGAPGDYSVRLATAFNWYDLIYSVMDGSPKTVNFTLAAPASNQPPVITPIGDKVVVETNLLSFQVTATDTDLPPQTLTFSLDPGAPAAAVINSSNGLFAWTPPAGDAPRTNEITVRVTDDGSPPLSATETFRVIVLQPPRILSISGPTNGVITLIWQSFPGQAYRVQFKDDLGAPSWTPLGSGDIVATNLTASTTNLFETARQRFYQVLLLD